jgi:DNA-binding transcriptional MerR regulator
MNAFDETSLSALQLFEPDPRSVYTIETAAHLVHLPRRMILIYCKHGLISPVADPEGGGYYFNDEAIRDLRRIEYLRTVCGINLVGIKMILRLMNEAERLRNEVRSLYG